MRKTIHPEYVECSVRCSCGNTFTTRATKPSLRIELCNECHPFYTGQQKFVDTGGRVQRFSNKYGSASEAVAEREAARRDAKAKAAAEAEQAARAQREQKAAAKAAKAQEFAEKSRVAEPTVAEVDDSSAVEVILASAAELSLSLDAEDEAVTEAIAKAIANAEASVEAEATDEA
jgi:large subunit ribosomal protein L31